MDRELKVAVHQLVSHVLHWITYRLEILAAMLNHLPLWVDLHKLYRDKALSRPNRDNLGWRDLHIMGVEATGINLSRNCSANSTINLLQV